MALQDVAVIIGMRCVSAEGFRKSLLAGSRAHARSGRIHFVTGTVHHVLKHELMKVCIGLG